MWCAPLEMPGEVMKLSGLLCPSALFPHSDSNVPVEALRPLRGARAFGRTSKMLMKSDATGPPRSVWQSGGVDGLRSEERRVGKGVDLGGRRIIKKKKKKKKRRRKERKKKKTKIKKIIKKTKKI